MAYFLRTKPQGSYAELWDIQDRVAVRVGVTNAMNGLGTHFRAESGEDIWDAMRRQAPSWFDPTSGFAFHRCRLDLGEYYPRIAKPTDQHPRDIPGFNPATDQNREFIAMARGQLLALTRQLDRICQTIHPSTDTFDSYGHDIRNLIILACTEVEMHWRGILVANGVPNGRLNTSNYVALQAAMYLGEYAVSFPSFPWLSPIRPFERWGTTGQPTQELPWYDAYNHVKHNRESAFPRASLLAAFEAVSACAIMLCAEFGRLNGLGHQSELTAFFHLAETPQPRFEDAYLYPYGSEPAVWRAVNYPF